MPLKTSIARLAVCLGIMLGASARADDAGRRYLALDRSLHGALKQARMVLGTSGRTRKITSTMDQPWQKGHSLQHGVITGVFRDHDGLYRMVYHARPNPDESVIDDTAVMRSRDGIHWEPYTTGVKVDGSNLISVEATPKPGSVTVFYDSRAPESERYKAVKGEANTSYVTASADGVHFGPLTKVFDHRNEHIISAFYDTRRGQYVMYGRIRGPKSWIRHNGKQGLDKQRRGAAMHATSGKWPDPWDNVGNTVLDPEIIWDYAEGYNARRPRASTGIRPDFYQPAVSPYHGQYIGMPTTFYRDARRQYNSDKDYAWTGTGPQYPTLMHSLDGVHFTLADTSLRGAHSILDLTPHLRRNPAPDGTRRNEREVGQIHAAPTILETKDRLLLYYFVRNDTHYEGYEGEREDRGHYVTELRVDGFAGIRADKGRVGEWCTTTVNVPDGARALLVNAKVAGRMRLEVLDAKGVPVETLSLDDSVAFTGDEIRAPMRWNSGRFAAVAGRKVQLRFVIEDGEIYGFAFSVAEAPSAPSRRPR